MHTTKTKRRRAVKAVRALVRRSSYDAVALRLSVPRSTVWRWAKGKRLPTAESTARILLVASEAVA